MLNRLTSPPKLTGNHTGWYNGSLWYIDIDNPEETLEFSGIWISAILLDRGAANRYVFVENDIWYEFYGNDDIFDEYSLKMLLDGGCAIKTGVEILGGL